jgi:hypothetical protein
MYQSSSGGVGTATTPDMFGGCPKPLNTTQLSVGLFSELIWRIVSEKPTKSDPLDSLSKASIYAVS